MNKFRSYEEVKKALKKSTISCEKLIKQYLKSIEENTDLNAFVEVFSEEAIAQAKKIDQKLKKGSAGKLAGMTIGIKDNICYKNHKVSAGSKILQGFESIYTATAIQKLINEDAIIIGRLNCDEFAMGSSNENSVYGPVKNPHNKQKVPGGSSGGSATAVAAGLCLASLGSDTGGSIRQPASFCGVFGLKPTYGRVSRHGLIAYASSFDQIGPIANTAEDIGSILEVISGPDEFDGTTSTKRPPKITTIKKLTKPKRIAYIKEAVHSKKIDEEIKEAILLDVDKLRKKGHFVKEISFTHMDYLVPTYYVLTTAEASSNLARFDGIRFGYRSKKSTNLEKTYTKTRTEGFGREVKRRIMLGTFVLSEEYQEEYFTKAQKIRRIIQTETNGILKKFDFILTPTTPHTAFNIGGKKEDPTKMYLEDIFTVQANLTGNPAISIPLHKHSNGMPFGIQCLGQNFQEKELLRFSKEFLL